jgi:hypothetical protein
VKLFASSVGAIDISTCHDESQTLVTILSVAVVWLELWLCIGRVFLRQLYDQTMTDAKSNTAAKYMRKLDINIYNKTYALAPVTTTMGHLLDVVKAAMGGLSSVVNDRTIP